MKVAFDIHVVSGENLGGGSQTLALIGLKSDLFKTVMQKATRDVPIWCLMLCKGNDFKLYPFQNVLVIIIHFCSVQWETVLGFCFEECVSFSEDT